ncbi:hypothetical protein [Apilactobacillus apinorum]|uniref:hypothetical protein n=1 Tax=Apilactobacillus apinorum TaxID=1218495 RepID=UPI0006B49F59|nr:hypothetical protein [Apilactobacillus apinorum]KOY68998.1 hypothetical protein RZ74_07980 [Apilactobacillus apinorum]CAI2679288.1 Hypothetical protein AAPFHON13_08480 [Apilactobacillus apinorum]
MTETFRQAAINTDITVSGIDELFKASDLVDKLRDKMEGLTGAAKTAGKSMSNLTGNNTGMREMTQNIHNSTSVYQQMITEVDRVNSSVRNVRQSLMDDNTEVNRLKQTIDGFSHSRDIVQSVNDKFIKNNESLNKNISKVKEFQKSIDSIKGKSISDVDESSKKAGRSIRKADEDTHKLRDTLGVALASNAISNVVSSIPNFLKESVTQGLKFSSAGADAKRNWANIGLNKSDTSSMLQQLGSIREHADISGNAITNMQKRYLALTNGNVKQAQSLTSSITSFGKDSQFGDRQYKMMNRMMGSNQKVNAGMFNKTALGPIRNEIIKMSGLSTNAFNNMLNSGKFTGNQLRSYMISASRDSGKAWNQYLSTDRGKMDMLNSTIASTKKRFDTGVSGNLFKSIQRIVGKGKSLQKIQKMIEGIGASLGKNVGNFVGKAVAFITKNRKPLKEIGSAVWSIVQSISAGAWDTIKGVLNVLGGNSGKASHGLNGVAKSLQNISKHKKGLETIGKLLVSVFAVSKILKFKRFFVSIIDDMSSPIAKVAKRIGKVSTVLRRTGKISKTFKFLHPTAFKQVSKIAGGFKKIYSVGKTTFSFLGSKALSVGKDILTFVKSINVAKIAQKAWSGITKAFTAVQWAFNAALDANPIGIATLAIAGLVGGIYELYKHFKPFRKIVNGAFKMAGKSAKWFGNIIKRSFNVIKKTIGKVLGFVKSHFKSTWKNATRTFKNAWKSIKDVLKVFSDIFHGRFGNLKKDIPKLIKDMWKTLKGLFSGGFDFVKDLAGNALKGMWNTFKSWGSDVAGFFSKLWKQIKNDIADRINDITWIINQGIKGLNWLLSKMGVSGHTIGTIPKVHFAGGTMDGKLPRNTMAMLNDGHDSPSTQNKELVQLPNGREFIPQKPNWIGYLPKGSRIFNATQTKMLMELRGIKRYSGGTISNFWNGAKDVVGDIGHGIKTAAGAIAHPIKFIEGLFGHLPKLPEFFKDFGGGVLSKVKDMAIHFFNNNSGGAGNPGGSSVDRWIPIIKKAAAFMHDAVNGNDIQLILKRIARESGGNPKIMQKVQDVNSRAGHPAQGLLQYVPSTFASWAVNGHKNLLNGFDQLTAMFNDSNWKSDIANNGGWGPSGHRARRNGGPVKANDIYHVAEDGYELFKPKKDGNVINHESSKNIINHRNRPVHVDYHPNIKISGTDNNNLNKLHDELENNRDELSDMLNELIHDEDGGESFGILY